ncbi:hypothetical protein ACFL6G_09665 [candidate division KSB1 bacterium]
MNNIIKCSMRMRILLILGIACLCFVPLFFTYCSSVKQNKDFPVLKGPYLGQKPPGMTPEIFAPGVISTNVTEGCIALTRDNKLLLFARRGRGILYMQQIDGKWTAPEPASFSAGTLDWDFFIAPDDKTLFVSSRRPDVFGGDTLQVYRIWKSEWSGVNWSAPVLLPAPINSGQHDSFASITEGGTLYFFSNRQGGLGRADIYRSRRIGNDYPEVENLGSPINTEHRDLDAYVDPGEQYMIFCSNRPGGFGKTDLYISFRTKENTWSDPVNMGKKINSEAYEVIPYITPDRKYFFFVSDRDGNGEVYWVDAKIIEELKPDYLKKD